MTVGLAFLAGGEDFLSGGLVSLRPPLRTPPRALEELAGSGLLKRSGCAQPSPLVQFDDPFAPAQLWPWP
jgi:hypothetical protein